MSANRWRFFNLLVSCTGGGTTITHYAGEQVVPAPDCSKASMLTGKVDELSSVDIAKSLTTDFVPTASRDVTGPQTLSCAAFLDYTPDNPTASMPEIMQLMLVQIEEPEPDEIVTDASRQRIWYRIRVRDASGSTTVGIPEKHALALASCRTRDAFLEKHAASDLNMPLLCHARVSRNVRHSEAGTVFVNHTVEDVEPVSWAVTSAPNAAYNDLIKLLNMCPAHNEGIVFAYLGDIEADPHYGFKVAYDGVHSPRSAFVVSLVASTAKSTTTNVGGGFQVTTPAVNDHANPAGASQPSFTLVGFCTLDNLPGFRLDPPRGKAHRYAICLISRREEDQFHIHKLEYIEQDQIDNATRCFQKLRKLCKAIMPTTAEKRSHSVSVCSSSVADLAKRARSLHAMPTDVSME